MEFTVATPNAIRLGESEVSVGARVDVLILGGGVAGLAAAVAAARQGAETLLIERAGSLGGTATSSLMALIVIPFDELAGFPRELFSRLARDGGARQGRVVAWDPEKYKLTALEVCHEEGVDVLLYTTASEPLVDKGRVVGALVDSKSGRQAILATVTVDTTGDGDMAARAGATLVKGRSRDGAMRPVTVMGRFANVDLRCLGQWLAEHPDELSPDPGRNIFDLTTGIVRIDGFFSVIDTAKQSGLISPSTPINYLRFSGVVADGNLEHADLICNSTRVYGIDGTNARDLTRAEYEGRKQLDTILNACRALVPGFEHSYLVATSSQLGVRETRRIQGRYMLALDDVTSGRHFPDSLARMTSLDYGRAEVHGADPGMEGSASDTWARDLILGLTSFEFPAECLVPVGPSHLLVAGRCASVTHEVDTFTRNMAPTALMGQGAGTLAALLAQGQGTWDCLPVEALQSCLSAQGVPLFLSDPAVINSGHVGG